MSNTVISRPRRWVAASALAVALGAGGVSGALLMSEGPAVAQVSVAPGNVPGSFADLVDAVSPAVVSIQVEAEVQAQRRGGDFGDFFPDLPEGHPFRDFFDQFGDQFGDRGGDRGGEAPRSYRTMAAGSGFVISADGYVVTNNHVVSDATSVTVLFDNGDEVEAEVVGTDPRTDLAVLKIDGGDNLPYVEFTDEEARVGDWVVAVGNPFGLGGTVTAGIISAHGRDIRGSAYGDFLQIDAAVNTGNSGGPAFGLDGKVVGVNTAIYSPNGGNVGIAFAIPADVVERIVLDLIDDGDVTRGFLGVGIQDISRDLADSLGLERPEGAMVTEPTEGFPAAEAGIRSGDVIVAINGDRVDGALDLTRTISNLAPGTEVTVTIFRDGEEMDLTVTLATYDEEQLAEVEPQQPMPEPQQERATSSVGLVLAPNPAGGVIVEDIEPGTPAAEKGFAPGDVILEADGTEIASIEDFEQALSQVRDRGADTVTVKISRDGAVRFEGLPLSDD